MESSSFRLSVVRYCAGGDDATILGILRIGALHGGDDILPFYQLPQNLELLFCGGKRLIPLLFRQDGQILQPLFGVGLTVSLLLGQLHQMADTSAHKIPTALHVAVAPLDGAQHLAHALRHRGFLADHEFTHRRPLFSCFWDKK